ncbi:uncharacterized protein N7483_009081 [Penicillium malachiteum]|uniref:uncharacterized protein n=1 Tax=Penicillium malachiteum TaxID=1324776 RepID=UPI0025492C6C|nr:uncharacterized protein N7483_009081 [Penicillium malachiteum]KAJ5721147.1 hypothetical protein N7483_009081 [Penicillium malachiteum]
MAGPSEAQVGNMLASSATGTTFLILIQVASRMFTFLSNQLILRALSPMVLGIAAQLELYQVSILYFSRESIRMAIQRQPLGAKTSKLQSTASQSIVNISYLSPLLGIAATTVFTILYQHFAPEKALETSFFNASVIITGLAALMELTIEPFFAIIQQQMLYQKRAVVEMPAAFMKSFTTCTIFLYTFRTGQQSGGALPFAFGHLSYSITLVVGYCALLLPRSSERRFSFLPVLIKDRAGAEYFLGRFSRKLSSLAASLFFQSVVKHLLTQGDSMMLAAMASLEDQGIYSLASNYGGLIARIMFQPLEESSRNLFSRLLSPDETGKRNITQVRFAKQHLTDLLRAYQLLLVLVFPIGPIVVAQGLHLLGSRQWASPQVGDLLSLYCYYIPFLAFNGITEAFVASAASPKEIRHQAIWMGAFSVCYALAAYLFLEVWFMGAYGLVLANIVNMAVRILWSYMFIRSYLAQHEGGLRVADVSIHPVSYVLGILATVTMITQGLSAADQDLLTVIAFSGTYALVYVEREYLTGQAMRLIEMVHSRKKGTKAE